VFFTSRLGGFDRKECARQGEEEEALSAFVDAGAWEGRGRGGGSEARQGAMDLSWDARGQNCNGLGASDDHLAGHGR